MSKKQFAIIGLGRFGRSVAKTLYELGNDVLVIDKNEDIVEEMAELSTKAICMDVTEKSQLLSLGLRNFDVVIVSIGDDLESNVLITLNLKEIGVKKIICKAKDEMCEKVLMKIGADKVVLPEKDMGIRMAYNLVSSNVLDYIQLSEEYGVMEIEVAPKWEYKTLIELDLRKKYDINVVAVKSNNTINVNPYADYVLKPNDILVVIGSKKSLNKLEDIAIVKKGMR